MKIDEQIKRLTELADVVKRESETLKSLVRTAVGGSELRLHPSGVTRIADILEVCKQGVNGNGAEHQKGKLATKLIDVPKAFATDEQCLAYLGKRRAATAPCPR